MPLILSFPLAKWLKQSNIIQEYTKSYGECEISYNDQLYFENGYLIGQLLKHILKAKGFASEALLRIRKIAHISSNQNWNIIKEIMQEIHFEDDIDTHAITLDLVQRILEFLFEHFGPLQENITVKKEKKTYIDPATFLNSKPLEESYNLLQFFVLAVTKVFSIPLQQCLGLLVDNCKYFKQVVVEGTNNNGFEPVVNLYKLIAQNMPLVNRLIAEQPDSEISLMKALGLAVLSDSLEVCDIGCIIIDNLESNCWLQQQGSTLLLRSPHDKVLDLLLRRIHPNFSVIFNHELSSKFPNKFVQLINYGKLLKYLYKSIYSREIFELLPLNHYLQSAFEIFEPDNIKQLPKKVRLAAKNLMKVIVTYFWGKVEYEQRNKICFSFETQFCQSEQERIATLCFLFQMITQLSIRQAQFVKKFYRIINKFYAKGTIDIRTFILNNLIFLYENHPDHFPIGFFLETYQIATPVQTCDYQLIELVSRNRALLPEEQLMMLKICTIYYYQQLQAACFLEPIKNLLKNYTPVEWASQLTQEILNKWPTLPIPPFQMLPPNTNKIKFRSIGLKKKEMIQFTELNRYKSILKLLKTVKNKDYLVMFGRLIGTTISKVEKSKIKEMQNTKAFLNNLLAGVDGKKLELKEQKTNESIRSKSVALRASELSDKIETDPFLEEYDRREDLELNTPINVLEDNEFMPKLQPSSQTMDPLLPFTDEDLSDLNEKNYSQDALLENYELIYIKNAATKYESLLSSVAQQYEKSVNLSSFLKSLNIYNYFQKDLTSLQISEDRLKLAYDNPASISFKLTVELAFLLFQFKKSRRITIKCLESFYELLMDKTNFHNEKADNEKSKEKEGTMINAKIDFKHQITNKNIQCNKSSENYIVCFEVVSELLKKAIGIFAVEPISCIISQILPFSEPPSPSKMMKEMQKSRISDVQLKQYEELEKMIENQSKVEPPKNIIYSTPLKRAKNAPPFPSNQKESKASNSQKWAEVQKKVIMRRRELEGKQKSINEA